VAFFVSHGLPTQCCFEFFFFKAKETKTLEREKKELSEKLGKLTEENKALAITNKELTGPLTQSQQALT
jgi:hypothetical protein